MLSERKAIRVYKAYRVKKEMLAAPLNMELVISLLFLVIIY
jgi:hypothetical protein